MNGHILSQKKKERKKCTSKRGVLYHLQTKVQVNAVRGHLITAYTVASIYLPPEVILRQIKRFWGPELLSVPGRIKCTASALRRHTNLRGTA